MADMNIKFWNESGSGYAPRLHPNQWESVRGRITEWVRADLQNREVIALLLEEYGLRISEGQLKGKVKEWRLQGRRARRALAMHAVEIGNASSQLVEEAGISYRVANPALHSFAQTASSHMNLEGRLPSFNVIFKQGNERLGFDGPRGILCMSRAPLHTLEQYQSQVWPLEAMTWRIREMQQALQKQHMGLHDILVIIDLCTELCLISIFIEEADEATNVHRSAYTTLVSLLCSKVGMFTRPMTMVFESMAMMVNYWTLGWPRRRAEDLQPRRIDTRQRLPSQLIRRFIGALSIMIGEYMKQTLADGISRFSA